MTITVGQLKEAIKDMPEHYDVVILFESEITYRMFEITNQPTILTNTKQVAIEPGAQI